MLTRYKGMDNTAKLLFVKLPVILFMLFFLVGIAIGVSLDGYGKKEKMTIESHAVIDGIDIINNSSRDIL